MYTLRPDGVQPGAHRQLPDVRLPRRAAADAALRVWLARAPGDELHRRGRSDDCRRAEGGNGPSRLHRSVHRRVSRRRGGAWPGAGRGQPARDRRGEPEGDGGPGRGAREERPHLSQRRVGLLPHRHLREIRPAGAARSGGHQARRAHRHATITRKTMPAISCCGRRRSPTSRPGISDLARAGPDGISNARRWRCACSASRRSTFTPAASI